MMPRPSLPRGTPTCASRSSCARSARAHSPGWTPRSPSTPPGSSSPRWTPSTTRRCRPRGVTGSGRVPHSRSSATMPDLAEVLAAHLAHLRLLGRSERTVYDRERAVIRLAAWLRPVPVLAATAADLGAWRASLTVGDQAVVVYCAHVAGFYAFAVTPGPTHPNPPPAPPAPPPPPAT